MRDPLRDVLDTYRSGAPILPDARFFLRWGLGFVFLWFGIDKFVHPAYWFMWIPDMFSVLRTPAAIASFAVFESVVGLALIFNVRVRETSLIAGLFLAGVIATTGLDSVVRDVGLLGMAIYLVVTTAGPTRVATPERALRNISVPKRALVVVGIVLLGGAIAVGVDMVSPDAAIITTPPQLVFETPEADFVGQAGDLPVKVRIISGSGHLLANHVHFKVDGQVMDAVYLREGESSAGTVLKGLDAGTHVIEVYLAYADHIESPGSRATVTVTLEP